MSTAVERDACGGKPGIGTQSVPLAAPVTSELDLIGTYVIIGRTVGIATRQIG